jgi:D-alanyl-D-alanine carboxypeptidase
MARKSQQEIEIASLTKIMTCFLTLLICKKYEIDMTKCTYRVPDKIADTPGTSAELEAGDLLTIEDLLYGLMLPSGNDASICIAELMGKMIQKCKKK